MGTFGHGALDFMLIFQNIYLERRDIHELPLKNYNDLAILEWELAQCQSAAFPQE